MLIILWLVVDDPLVDLVVVLIEMRREANDELIEQGTDAVDVGEPVVALSHQDFWAHVFGAAAE